MTINKNNEFTTINNYLKLHLTQIKLYINPNCIKS